MLKNSGIPSSDRALLRSKLRKKTSWLLKVKFWKLIYHINIRYFTFQKRNNLLFKFMGLLSVIYIIIITFRDFRISPVKSQMSNAPATICGAAFFILTGVKQNAETYQVQQINICHRAHPLVPRQGDEY